MDFGVVSLDGLVGSDSCLTSLASSDPETNKHNKWYGSGGFLKQERSTTTTEEDFNWRSSKLFKTEPNSRNNNNNNSSSNNSSSSLLPSKSNTITSSCTTSLFTDGQQQQQQQMMLSFSCPKSDSLSVERNSSISSVNATLPYFHLSSSSPYNRISGYNSGSYNGSGLHGVLTEARGPFTHSQWIELEHQALIYKYINANVPIPTNLLLPIRKALESAGFSTFAGGLLRPNTLAWGPFHLGFSGNTDPEPGRCRRTDGKKWRCSRDAVADQKYCERHMNRGRHRSRKPVEGQSGHPASATNKTTPKPMPTASTTTTASVVGPCGSSGTSNSVTISQHQQQFKNLHSATTTSTSSTPSAATPLNRMFLDKEGGGERIQDLSPNLDLKSKETSFPQHKLYEGPSRAEFGFVTSDSLLNPSQRSSSLISCRNFGSSQDLTDQETVSQHSFRQFMDDWPKSHTDRTSVSWPELDMQSDRTQLSISIPMTPADFMSSTSSPNNEKVTLSPLRLSRELDPIQMGLGVGSVLNESNHRQANWIPISWESSMGGPLGEVLHNTSNNNSTAECKNSSALNLMTEGWDSSPRLNSSPTGVLQKTTFGSLSNSSAGSSPRAENNKTSEGVSLCKDLQGSTLVHSSSLPAL